MSPSKARARARARGIITPRNNRNAFWGSGGRGAWDTQRVVGYTALFTLSGLFVLQVYRSGGVTVDFEMELPSMRGKNNTSSTATIETVHTISAMVPIDLSVNHLPLIPFPDFFDDINKDTAATEEDFLPIVVADDISLRWRLQANHNYQPPIESNSALSLQAALRGISSYRIIAETAHSPHTLVWDSGRVRTDIGSDNNAGDNNNNNNNDGMFRRPPRSVEWDYDNLNHQKSSNNDGTSSSSLLSPGSIVRWRVEIWDGAGQGPATSGWSKFGVGPGSHKDDASSPSAWEAEWITHPVDYDSLFVESQEESSNQNNNNGRKPRERLFKNTNVGATSQEECDAWKLRTPMPLARASFTIPAQKAENKNGKDQIVSALLVVSGLGMFSVTVDGKRLTTSSVHDPPLTDFAQRVMYRGFDITQHLLRDGEQQQHAIGIALSTGLWDHRPINGNIVYTDFMAKGSLATVAQLHVQYADGRFDILVPTNSVSGVWHMGKGHLQDSGLYTGDIIDLTAMDQNQGWDTVQGIVSSSTTSRIKWIKPVAYRPGISTKTWRERLNKHVVEPTTEEKVPANGPIGNLVPYEIPPVMPVEKIEPVRPAEDLGAGRWLLDFGKSMSGVVRFDSGLQPPQTVAVKEDEELVYPRGHDLSMITNKGDSYITVIHGDSLEMATGDINLKLVAGFGHHNGGDRGNELHIKGGPCFPPQDLQNYQALTQRDVYLTRRTDEDKFERERERLFQLSRQPQFTVHGFRYAEVCCMKLPPKDVHAIQYRTAFPLWGEFSSSNPVFNGAYEMTKNSFESNMLGLQSDCPHRERLQYGGDIVAVSQSAMHFFDLSAFYAKIIRDWTESQYDNGAYPLTSTYMGLLVDMAVARRGSGETVWASVAPVLAVRHMHHYGDDKLAIRTLHHHANWLAFLDKYWNASIAEIPVEGDPKNSARLWFEGHGLGDWLAIAPVDNWLTHHTFYMASARAVAYLASKLFQNRYIGIPDNSAQEAGETHRVLAVTSLQRAKQIERTIRSFYVENTFSIGGGPQDGIGQDAGLFTRAAEGQSRCSILKSWLIATGNGDSRIWPGDEEVRFHQHLETSEYRAMQEAGLIAFELEANKTWAMYKTRYAIDGGILGIRYSLKTLSEMGFHNIALTKASGSYMPSYGMMLSFNATTLWETFWRSEDTYSRNHPMMGAVAEWLASAVAGISLLPSTTGGDELLYWPRIPNTIDSVKTVRYANARQGTKWGDAYIAWMLVASTSSDADAHSLVIRLVVPPGSTGKLRLPLLSSGADLPWMIRISGQSPDLAEAGAKAKTRCEEARKEKNGFPFHWHYDAESEKWRRVYQQKAIGTPCESLLFMVTEDMNWQYYEYKVDEPSMTRNKEADTDMNIHLQPGFYEITSKDEWRVRPDIPDKPGYGYGFEGSVGSRCSDPSSFEWEINDAEHFC